MGVSGRLGGGKWGPAYLRAWLLGPGPRLRQGIILGPIFNIIF